VKFQENGPGNPAPSADLTDAATVAHRLPAGNSEAGVQTMAFPAGSYAELPATGAPDAVYTARLVAVTEAGSSGRENSAVTVPAYPLLAAAGDVAVMEKGVEVVVTTPSTK
jgi:hypothetical protein